MTTIEMVRGDTVDFDTFVTRSGAPVDLSGAVVTFMLKHSVEDLDAAAVYTMIPTIVPPTTLGKIHTTVPPAATSGLENRMTKLVWEIQVSQGGNIWTVDGGPWIMNPEVVRA